MKVDKSWWDWDNPEFWARAYYKSIGKPRECWDPKYKWPKEYERLKKEHGWEDDHE